jgi:hypothetical protein
MKFEFSKLLIESVMTIACVLNYRLYIHILIFQKIIRKTISNIHP